MRKLAKINIHSYNILFLLRHKSTVCFFIMCKFCAMSDPPNPEAHPPGLQTSKSKWSQLKFLHIQELLSHKMESKVRTRSPSMPSCGRTFQSLRYEGAGHLRITTKKKKFLKNNERLLTAIEQKHSSCTSSIYGLEFLFYTFNKEWTRGARLCLAVQSFHKVQQRKVQKSIRVRQEEDNVRRGGLYHTEHFNYQVKIFRKEQSWNRDTVLWIKSKTFWNKSRMVYKLKSRFKRKAEFIHKLLSWYFNFVFLPFTITVYQISCLFFSFKISQLQNFPFSKLKSSCSPSFWDSSPYFVFTFSMSLIISSFALSYLLFLIWLLKINILNIFIF